MTAVRHRRVAGAYFVTRSIVQRATMLTGAIFEGVWLGASTPQLLHAIDERYYDGERQYVDPGYNASGLLDWERAAIEDHFERDARVAVTSVGGGREALALLELGYDVVAFEPHPDLCASAQALLADRGWPGRVHRSERDTWPSNETFGGVVVGWGSYMLVQPRERRIELLRAIRRSVPADAPVLLSFFARDGGGSYATTVVRVANAIRALRRAPRATLGDRLVPNLVHYFAREEIEAELAAGGFDLVAFEARPYGHAVGRARPGEGSRTSSW